MSRRLLPSLIQNKIVVNRKAKKEVFNHWKILKIIVKSKAVKLDRKKRKVTIQ
jgi:hypothetical protein